MQIYKITKGNFALENTRDIRPHENNLRFHIKIEEKYYEYAIDNINKNTINVRCVIGKSKFRQKCYARLTLFGKELNLFSRTNFPVKNYVLNHLVPISNKAF